MCLHFHRSLSGEVPFNQDRCGFDVASALGVASKCREEQIRTLRGYREAQGAEEAERRVRGAPPVGQTLSVSSPCLGPTPKLNCTLPGSSQKPCVSLHT